MGFDFRITEYTNNEVGEQKTHTNLLIHFFQTCGNNYPIDSTGNPPPPLVRGGRSFPNTYAKSASIEYWPILLCKSLNLLGLQKIPSAVREAALRKLCFSFLPQRMGYDCGDSFPFDFLSQMDFHLVQNRKENCHYGHTPFNVKGKGNKVFSVCPSSRCCEP